MMSITDKPLRIRQILLQGKSSISTNILTHPIILRPSPTILTYLPAVKTQKFNIHLSNIIFSQRCSSRYSKLSAPVSSLVQDEMFDLPLVCYAIVWGYFMKNPGLLSKIAFRFVCGHIRRICATSYPLTKIQTTFSKSF